MAARAGLAGGAIDLRPEFLALLDGELPTAEDTRALGHRLGTQLRRAQTGYVRSYALSLLGGVLLVVLALLAVNFA